MLESIWIALSFQFPMIYDEGTHMSFIRMYSDDIFPYTNDTPGNMTTQISLFHYLMSFPFRIMSAHVDFNIIVILFRLVGIGFMLWGLLIYSRVLQRMKIPAAVVNISLLIFILLPIVPFVAATVNYDNLLFPLTALYVLYAVKIIEKKRQDFRNIALLIIVGCVAALVKYSFLPIFVASAVFLIGWLFYHQKFAFIEGVKSSYLKLKKRQKILWPTLLILVLIPFLGVFGVNAVKYHGIKPSCFKVQPREQCLANGIIKRTVDAEATVNERQAVPPTNFVYSIWLNNMLKTTNWSGNITSNKTFAFAQPLPVMDAMLFAGVLLGTAILLFMWRSLNVSTSAKFGVLLFVVLTATILIMNMKTYYDVRAAYANQPRYLLSLLPIYLAVMVWAVSAFLGKRYVLKTAILVIFLLLFTQGGGVITHMVRSDESWYWQNPIVRSVNVKVKSVLSKVVIEGYGK